MEPEDIKRMIAAAMPDAYVEVVGDGEHFQAVVVSDRFEGKGLVEQHQMVYAALGDSMREKVHALSIKTYTPQEWNRQRG